jgi:hypothetical protein
LKCQGKYLELTGTRLTGEWRRLHIEELHDLYSSPNIIQVIKSKRKRWAEHLTFRGERRGAGREVVR